jgi:hypothetical protein
MMTEAQLMLQPKITCLAMADSKGLRPYQRQYFSQLPIHCDNTGIQVTR